jgi:hypothetical protein
VVASFFLSFPFWDICLKKKKQKQLYCSMKRLMLNWTRTVATCVFSFASIYTSMGVRTSTVLCCFVDLDFHIWVFDAKRKKKEKRKRCPFHRNTMLYCLMHVCVTEKKSDTSCLFVFFSVGLSVCLSSCLFLYHNVNLPLSDRFSLEFLG